MKFVLLLKQTCMCRFRGFQVGVGLIRFKWAAWKASACWLWGSLLGANPLEMHQTSRQGFWQKCHDFKLVMLLLTFHKGRIFSFKKLVCHFLLLQVGAETVVPWVMQWTLFSKKKKIYIYILETTRIRFQFVQKLYKKAKCEKLQVIRPDLHFIKKIIESGFVTSKLEPMISKGFTILPDKWFYFSIKSAKWFMVHNNFNMGRGRTSLKQ